jgi:hypothetical protein
MRWFVIVGMLAWAAYGLLNIFMPATTIRWQNRATARRTRGGRKDAVGLAFQRALGQTTTDGRNEPHVRQRVRLLGLTELVLAAVAIVVTVTRT